MHEYPSFRAYAHQTSVGILVIDREGRVSGCNPAFSEMSGYAPDELRGRLPETVLYGELTEVETVRRLSAAVAEGRSCVETLVLYSKGGRPRWVAIQGSPIDDEERDLRCFVALVHRLAELPAPFPRDQQAGGVTWPALIPVCAQCKKVRDGQGTWRRVETFLQSLGQEQLTHGLCRDCIDEWT